MRTTLLLAAALPAAFLLTAIEPAAAAEHFEAGKLECDLSGDFGAILGAKQEATCTFTPSAPGAAVRYTGKISEFGLDIGEIKKAKLVWLVDAVSKQPAYDLEGTYRGVEADAALGLGAGAVVLTGGTHGTLSLQPVAVEGDEGLNVAIGVTQLNLKPAI